MFLTVAIGLAPAAEATTKPVLVDTNPGSPSTAITPRVRGDSDGAIAGAVGSALARSAGPITMGSDPSNPITLYTDSNCTGKVAAKGTAGELDGAGIPVTVAPDSETTFYATQTDTEGTSGCSNGVTYQQVTTPPNPPVFTAVSPASPANDNFPFLSGTVAANSIVFIYSNPDCSGGPVATGTAAAFSAGGIQAQVADNSATGFYAVAMLAGISSDCSSSTISYHEVTPPDAPGGGGGGGGSTNPAPPSSNGPAKPQAPHLRTIPGGIANDVTPLVTGSAPGAAVVKIYTTADCKGPVAAKGSAAQFGAGLQIEIVANTTVAFYGRSVDGDGDESACSDAPAVYTDDSIAPRTHFTAGPGVKTLKHTVVFRFADLTGGLDTSFLCKLDRRKWRSCHAPLRLHKLGHRRHLLRVKAFDAAGNREKAGAKRRFQVITGQ
jgi:hypothetical protein